MKNSCPLWDSSPEPFDYETKALPLSYKNELMSVEWIKVHLVLTVVKQQNNTNIKYKNTQQIILLHLPCAAGKFQKIVQLKRSEILSTGQISVLIAQW